MVGQFEMYQIYIFVFDWKWHKFRFFKWNTLYIFMFSKSTNNCLSEYMLTFSFELIKKK